MSNKLSHSSTQRYLQCGESYRLHYKMKLRPNVTSSALMFGSALDSAIGSILKKDINDPMKVFMDSWEYVWINKRRIHMPMSTQVVYAAADFDKALLTQNDLMKMGQALQDLGLLGLGDPLEAYNQVCTFKKQASHRHFREEEFKYLNYVNWLCMINKAKYLIDAFTKEVMPKIKEVKSVQKEITLNDDTGNSITGFIDLVAVWEDGREYILDIKTSARPYEEDAVTTNPQLALYAHHEGIKNAGFIVLQKNIKKDKTRVCVSCHKTEENNRVKACSNTVTGKRCGGSLIEDVVLRGEVQVVLGEVSERLETMVIDNFNDISKLIDANVFVKNLSKCDDYYGQKCPYYYRCHQGSDKGLEVVE